MADLKKKITELPAGTPISTDVIPYVDLTTGTTKKALKSDLKGDTGTAATADAGTTTTLAAGVDATVVNSGTTSAAVFDFGVPEGIQGIQGIQGITGDTGAAGADGVMSSVVAGTNVTVDATDPANPIVSSTATGTPEGTAILSTGETGAVKFLREDGDGTCSWQEPSGGGGARPISILGSSANTSSILGSAIVGNHLFVKGSGIHRFTRLDETTDFYPNNGGTANLYWEAPYLNSGITEHDSLLYMVDGGGTKFLRLDPETGSSTDVTISGTTLSSSYNGVGSDGTYLYVAERETKNLKRFTVSGTVATYVDTITVLSDFFRPDQRGFCIANNKAYYRSGPDGVAATDSSYVTIYDIALDTEITLVSKGNQDGANSNFGYNGSFLADANFVYELHSPNPSGPIQVKALDVVTA